MLQPFDAVIADGDPPSTGSSSVIYEDGKASESQPHCSMSLRRRTHSSIQNRVCLSLKLQEAQTKRLWFFPTGHVGAVVSPEAHAELWPKIAEWLHQRDAPA
jgi:hypothetical protein